MRQAIFFFLFIVNLYAQQIMPQWITNDPDNKVKYFRGTSAWYVTNDARMEKLAKDDAIKNAYRLISQYFGINIQSSFHLKDKVSNNINESIIKSDLKTKSNKLLLNLKPYKLYKEYDDSGENFRLYVLIRLDKVSERKIKEENDKDKKEFEELKQKALSFIEKKDYFKAKNFIELAKGKRSAYGDTTIENLQDRLSMLMNKSIISKININKDIYMPDEIIQLEASLNKQGYLYLFYVTSSDVEMIFPNKHQRTAYVKKEQLISFTDDSPYTLIAYEEDTKKDVMFYAIASKKNLNLKSMYVDSTDDVYIFNKNGKYKDIINKCIEQGECTKKIKRFSISNATPKISVEILFKTDTKQKQKFINYFKSKGIRSTNSNKKIIFEIYTITKYSKQLNTKFTINKIKATLYIKNKVIKNLENESSIKQTNKFLLDMYHKLIEFKP